MANDSQRQLGLGAVLHKIAPDGTENGADLMQRQRAMFEQVEVFTKAANQSATEALKQSQAPLEQGNPFGLIEIDLAATMPLRFNQSGYELHYKKDGSNPGGRLDVDINGKIVALAPGQFIRGWFTGFNVGLAERSARSGKAKLVLVERADARFHESDYAPPGGNVMDPVNLLGDLAAGTAVAMTAGTEPAGAAPAGSFLMTGYSRIRVLLSNMAGLPLTLTPYFKFDDQSDDTWWPQDDQAITIPANPYAATVAMTVVDLEGSGLMFLVPSQDCDMIVQGVQ
jgi:hypothetical protein